ncbi:prepilin peptidase [Nocardioides gansuensis]|uniref:Prepilin peptidase n=1 Tax=Nocardioides gansuensis TaxID=2138300 RepID=A0A2T8FB05_9ACTN|nr:A24 family peptidase [Nocardioides gansuensis]PVG82883.1 prepilin peptidase [Nocardioides gansuensis]
MTQELVAALAAAAVCGLGGAWVPTLVGRLPEPDSEPDASLDAGAAAIEADAPDDPYGPKEPYADIARLPGLAWKTALAAAVAGALVGAVVGLDWPLLVALPVVPVGVALAVIDWRTHLLPTRLIAPTYGVVVAAVVAAGLLSGDTAAIWRAGIGWLLAGGFFFLLWFLHPRGMGYGDVRLSGVLGLVLGYLGWGQLAVGLWAGFLLGGVGGLLVKRLRRRGPGYNPPFGPWMLVGALAGVALGAQVWASTYG